MVKIIVGNIYSKIVGILPEEVNQDLDNVLSYKIKDSRFIPSVKAKKWDGVVRLYQKFRGQSFLTGLMSLVRETLKKHNIEFELVDRRIRPEQNYPSLQFNPPKNYEPREYQELTIYRSLKFSRGILEISTGGGKTMIIAKMIGEIKTYPFLFYVLTKDLMEQAHDVLSTCLNVPIGMIGDGKVDIQKITVCTIQTAIMSLNAKNPNFKISDYSFDDDDSWDEKGIENEEKMNRIGTLIKTARGIYFDEVHHSSARTCKDVLLASPDAYWKFGGSATPKRESGDDIMIQALFGAKIVSISASYLIQKNYLVKPYIFFEPIECKTSLHSYAKIYKECVVDNIAFNKHVAETARHLISRNLSVLVLVKQIAHGKTLEALIPGSHLLTSKVTSENRTDIIEKLRQRTIPCMLATSLADEGLDIPSLDAVIIAGLGKSSTRLLQRIGRTLRKNKSDTKNRSIVVLYSHNVKYLSDHIKRVRSLLKREKEFVIMDSKGCRFICGEIDDILGVKNESKDLFNE
jgi:superfamily II DNA or RNA helicase